MSQPRIVDKWAILGIGFDLLSWVSMDRKLTIAEEKVMLILWQRQRAFVNDILADMPNDKPAYNTVSTIVRTLEEKGLVSHRAFGRTHEYFALLSKDDYVHFVIVDLAIKYFDGSLSNLSSFINSIKNKNNKGRSGSLKE